MTSTPQPVRTEIWVISRASDTERRRLFESRAAEASHPWRFFDAWESLHPALNYDPAKARRTTGRVLKPAEIGCYSSHYALWLQLLASDADQFLVLEDDVIVDWPFIGSLAQQRLTALGVAYTRLYSLVPGPYRIVVSPFVSVHKFLIQNFGLVLGTQAYFLAKPAAAAFAAASVTVMRPIDVQMDRAWAHGVPNLAVVPYSVLETAVDSTIGRGGLNDKLSHVDRHGLLLTRVIEKLRKTIYHATAPWRDWRRLARDGGRPEIPRK